MRLFHPLGFMLASPVETPEEAVARFTEKPPKVVTLKKDAQEKKLGPKRKTDEEEGQISEGASAVRGVEAFLEDKYDGMRAQVHCGDAGQPGRVAIYSRNREGVTASFPEIEGAFGRVRPELDGALIFDGEILGWDLSTARALPFAVLGTRIGRKKVSNEMRGQRSEEHTS